MCVRETIYVCQCVCACVWKGVAMCVLRNMHVTAVMPELASAEEQEVWYTVHTTTIFPNCGKVLLYMVTWQKIE